MVKEGYREFLERYKTDHGRPLLPCLPVYPPKEGQVNYGRVRPTERCQSFGREFNS